MFAISTITYLFSCEFFADSIILNLEKKYAITSDENIQKAQLYNKNPKEIYISGGSPLQNKESESSVYKKELILLGIPENNIIIEGI